MTFDRILSETHDQVRSLRTEYQPRFLLVVGKARADIAAALTPEHRAKFDKILKEKERLWKPKAGSTNSLRSSWHMRHFA